MTEEERIRKEISQELSKSIQAMKAAFVKWMEDSFKKKK